MELIKIQGGMNRLEKLLPDSNQQLLENGMRIAIASGTHLDTIDAILGHMKSIKKEDFAFVGHIGMVLRGKPVRGKPAPDIYNVALDSLQLKPTEVVAIEDTNMNLEGAIRAGIEQTIAVPGAFCKDQDFSKARLA